MYTEYYITLPGGFRLPIALAVEDYTLCMTTACDWEAVQNVLPLFAHTFLQSQMVAGSILSREEFLSGGEGLYRLEGEYVCTEMIGRVQREQIGEYHGEDR